MSKTIDERVVEMRFDNKQFESNVQTSLSTIDKLKQSLNLSGASKGLENVSAAAKNVNMSGLTGAVETVHARFSAFEVMAVTALANITNSAVNAGKQILSALTIEPVKSGFEEYETQINAIQTILANTESKGSTLRDVSQALDELNHYADMTIYNFTEMTRNIGTFTAAGVDLETSVSAIKGIANLAAVSGSTSQQASTAMYQLSQALAAGTVKLQDWNSVVNAGMGGQVFQDALKETARVHDIAIDDMIEKEGSFRETLSKGWLTSEILTETLSKFTGDLSEAQLQSMGYTEEQIASIIKMGQTANDAATKVKTLTQLFDTLKEAAQSGWTKTWELIVGDFDESKELFTGISDALSKFINVSADRRNNLLEGALSNNWDKLISKINEAGIETTDFEEKLKSMVSSHGFDVDKLIEEYGSLEKAFQSGAVSSDILKEAVNGLKSEMIDLNSIQRELRKGDAGEDVKRAQEALEKLGFDIGKTGVDGILGSATEEAIKAFQELNGIEITGIIDENTLNALKEATTTTETLVGNVDEFIDGITELGGREKIIESFKNILKTLGDTVKPVKDAFKEIFPPVTVDQVGNAIDKFHSFTEKLKLSEETADKLKRTFKGAFSILDLFGKGIKALISPIGDFFGSGGVNGIVDAFLGITASIGDFFTSLNEGAGTGAFFSVLSDGISNFFGEIAEVINPAVDGIETFGDVFSYVGTVVSNGAGKIGEGIKSVFTWISDNVSAGDIFAGLAGGGIFVLAKKISGVFDTIREALDKLFKKGESGKIKEQFSDILGSVKDSIAAFTSGIKVASLIGIAAAIGILSVALNSISKLEPGKLTNSLGAIGVMFAMLSLTLKSVTKTLTKFDSKGLIKAGVSLVLIATAVNIFAGALKDLSGMSAADMGKGLVGLGVGLVELSAALKIINNSKISLSTSVAIVALAQGCKMLADALSKFSVLSWDEIARGLTAMGGALAELTASLAVLSKAGGFGSLLGATGMLVAVQSLDEISENLEKLGKMTWDEIGRGLTAMGGALAEFSIALGALSKIGGFGSLLGGTGILIAAQSLDPIASALSSISGLSWSEIARGLTGMGSALAEFGIVLGTLGKIAGFSSVLGAVSVLIAAQSLEPIGNALASIGNLSWDEITRGLVGMGGALAELAVVIGALGSVAGISGVLGGGAILLGVQGLGDLADAFKKFGGMTWDEITTGLVGMGGALTEVSVITGLLGNLGGLGSLIGGGSILLGVQGLGDLADALKKFGQMNWDEIGTGLVAMGGALGETALGGLLNTFSGFGASAIAEMAEPLGALADSVKKWSGVSVPEGLSTQLGSLADGVKAFNFSGWGADAMAAIATPLGNMATSISKWSGVSVPENIQTGLEGLAGGVKAFNFSGWGADAMAAVSVPLGDMAGALGKWSNVTVPENIQTSLEGLASGVGAWAYIDTYNIGTITEPLENLAGAVATWNNITIPANIQTGLEGLANGISACNNVSGSDLSGVCDGIRAIGIAATDISTIDFSGISSQLTSFASSISNINVSTNSFSNLGSTIVSKFASAISSGTGTMSSAGAKLTNAVASGMKSGLGSLTSVITSIINSASTNVRNKRSNFVSAGTYLISGLASGIRSNLSSVSSAAGSAASSGASASRGYYGSFYGSGAYLVSGFAAGIRANIGAAASAAASMAAAASSAARSNLKIKSPSRVFYEIGDFTGQGFINALSDYGKASYEAGAGIAVSAREGLRKAISKTTDIIENGIDGTPTIRPVLDLSAVEAGAGKINGILGMGRSIGITDNIGAITTMMNNRQNAASNDDVISAIGKLQKALGNRSGDSYVINGVTYDDGSNVASAVKSLIRAAKVGGRV
ncbi:MAG: peptidoglycan-binding protein [Eubacteriales bacterium]|nr:peptidoglycan-binding protein [Eubacteriales bacterium]